MVDGKASAAERPLSPHLQIYRPMLTMMMSIVHRITGAALYFGTLLLAWWLIAAAAGPERLRAVSMVHRLAGRPARPVRLHLGADPSHARRHPPPHLGHRPRLRPERARDGSRVATLIGSIALTVLVWIVGYLCMGGPLMSRRASASARRSAACAASARPIAAPSTSGASA